MRGLIHVVNGRYEDTREPRGGGTWLQVAKNGQGGRERISPTPPTTDLELPHPLSHMHSSRRSARYVPSAR
eukprot:6878200-Prymnesium_polylepis.1